MLCFCKTEITHAGCRDTSKLKKKLLTINHINQIKTHLLNIKLPVKEISKLFSKKKNVNHIFRNLLF